MNCSRSTARAVVHDLLGRVGVEPGDHVLVDIRPVDIRPRLIPELKQFADGLLDRPETADALDVLANN